ncbi:esterase/lipase family protein [Pyruvatibacter sp. HU-CL02332]|uniref:esterase/lipase family protein n=1 Tax=Pyruvatibacter sp. HU-CL02332 TaxID=3127650 RepID=UPI002968D2D3|nr:alpha/beta hydrolase [Alphaproteobacteria bacterium]
MPVKTTLDFLRLQGDALWAGGEFTAKVLTEPLLDQVAPRADGATPVLTLPGFSGPEVSLRPLNRFLNRRGFVADSWGLGINRGPESMEYIATLGSLLGDRIKSMADENGKAVSLIGQSLGGVYARELARMFPKDVDRVITLGSPANLRAGHHHGINKGVRMASRLIMGRPVEELLNEAEIEELALHEPPKDVPLIAIYSPYDGVVHEDLAMIPEEFLDTGDATPRENIEIICSHIGMGVNPLVLLAVADRLLEDRNKWRAFNARDYMPEPLKGLPKLFFPEAAMMVHSSYA